MSTTRSTDQIPPGPQKGKNGPAVLKHECFKCQKKKWTVDFKEGKAADLTRCSTCLFCDLSDTIEKQASKISRYEQDLQELRKAMDRQEQQCEEKLRALQEKMERTSAYATPCIPSQVESPGALESPFEVQESLL